jgi:hypothetical protein
MRTIRASEARGAALRDGVKYLHEMRRTRRPHPVKRLRAQIVMANPAELMTNALPSQIKLVCS